MQMKEKKLCFLKNDEDIADAVQDTILTCFEKSNNQSYRNESGI